MHDGETCENIYEFRFKQEENENGLYSSELTVQYSVSIVFPNLVHYSNKKKNFNRFSCEFE